jgi:hypothetical protein
MQEQKHWAASLETGDRVTATIRHKTDGTLNKHNVPCIVIANYPHSNGMSGFIITHEDDCGEIAVPYNELSENSPNPMTYKAGDKVVWNDEICTFLAYNHNPQYVTLMTKDDDSFACKAEYIKPATPVEIAKQAVIDEVSSIANNSTELISNLLDQLISEVKIETLNSFVDTYNSLTSTDPDYIGKTIQKD